MPTCGYDYREKTFCKKRVSRVGITKSTVAARKAKRLSKKRSR